MCVEARGQEDPHYKQTAEELQQCLPKVCVDYARIGQAEDGSDQRKLLIGRDKWTQHTFCHLVKCKGLGDTKIVEKLKTSMNEPGYTKMVLKGDGEPALVQVQETVKERRRHPTILENPPAHDPQSNGVAERAVKEVKAQIRCVKLGLEARLGKGIDAKLAILEWMIPHAPELLNRFLMGRDGKTPFYRIHHRHFKAKTFEMGEQVLAKPTGR